MDENLHKDNLNDFFKNTFENQDEAPELDGWDSPSDTVWTSLNAHLEEDRPQRVLVYWKWAALAASLLVLIMSILLIRACEQTTNLKKQFLAQHTEINGVEKIIEFQKQASLTNTKTEENTYLNKTKEVSFLPESANNIASPISKENTVKKDIFFKETPKSTLTSNTKSNVNTSDHIITANNPSQLLNLNKEGEDIDNQMISGVEFDNEIKDNLILVSLPLLDIPSNEVIDENRKPIDLIAFTANQEYLKKIPKTQGHFLVGAYVSPAFRKYKVQDTDRVIPRFAKEEMHQVSKNIGLKLGYEWDNGWSVISGLEFQKHQQNALRFHRLEYTKFGREDGPGNTYKNDYDIDLNTSFGSISMVLPISESKEDEELGEGTELPILLKTSASVEVFSVPVLVQYRFGKGALKGSIKSGLATNITHQAWVEIDEVTPQNLRFKREPVQKKFEIEDIRKVSFDWRIGVGIHYAFNEHLEIDFEPTYKIGLTSISDNARTQTQTTSNSLALNAGLTYHF